MLRIKKLHKEANDMSNMIEKSAKTVEEAVNEALAELNVTKDNVDIEVLEEPTKGLLGIGARPAVVRVTVKENKNDIVNNFLVTMGNCLGVNVTTSFENKEDSVGVNLSGENMGIIIGHKGETLDALQLLTNVIANKTGDYKRFELDAQNYREKRRETLTALAQKKARDVIKYGRNITLEPMNPYERMLIHTALQNDEKVTTISIGNEPYRKVMIKKK